MFHMELCITYCSYVLYSILCMQKHIYVHVTYTYIELAYISRLGNMGTSFNKLVAQGW